MAEDDVAKLKEAVGDRLWTYTIFHDPLDHPDKYVVRRFCICCGEVKPEAEAFVCDTLDEARAAVPPGLFNLGREPQDEPQIVETWI